MAYFDDPAHKAQWEKELAALRQEKQRRMNSEPVNGRKPQHENAVKLPTFEELVQQAALRYRNKELGKPEKAPGRKQKTQNEPTHGSERVRITFAQLLAEEEKHSLQKKSVYTPQKQRTMEAGNAL